MSPSFPTQQKAKLANQNRNNFLILVTYNYLVKDYRQNRVIKTGHPNK